MASIAGVPDLIAATNSLEGVAAARGASRRQRASRSTLASAGSALGAEAPPPLLLRVSARSSDCRFLVGAAPEILAGLYTRLVHLAVALLGGLVAVLHALAMLRIVLPLPLAAAAPSRT